MKTQLRNFIIASAVVILTGLSTYAQVSVNNDGSSPASSAMLDVKSANKGVLIPQISLTGTLDATTVASPATSLLIYNVATAGTSPNNVTPGYYYWSSTAWTRLSVFAGGSGTTNYLPKWSSSAALGNSLLFDNGTNVGIGTASPGAKLDVAGRIWQTNTGHSVFLGEGAGAHDDLNNRQNIFIGYDAGTTNTTGYSNSGIGVYSLYLNTTGYQNTATGANALLRNSNGYSNTANGSDALFHNTEGSSNTANGATSLYSNTTGNNNTASGSSSLQTNTTGSNNTAIGYMADVASNNLSNATAIGANAIVGQSNSLVLGGTGANAVSVGIGTTTPAAKLDVIGAVKITDGTQGANKVLTSDANGLANWQTPAAPPASWLLAGNTGTVPGTNFIGTIDNKSLDFRTNNVLRTRITTKGAIETYGTGQSVFIGEGAGAADDLVTRQNVFIGYQSGKTNVTGFKCTANGFQSLYSNAVGIMNTAYGYQALYSNTFGSGNVAIGGSALRNCTKISHLVAVGDSALFNNGISGTGGEGNTAVGSKALYANTTGNYNTAIGYHTLFSNTSGQDNTAIGYQTLLSNIDGQYNTAIGIGALQNNISGDENTANGLQALYHNTTGYSNTAYGFNSLGTITTGNNNTGIGDEADVTSADLTNVTVIGANTLATASNQVRLGDGNITTFYCMGAYNGLVGATNRDLFVDNTGKIGYSSSSARYKDNIANMESVDWLYQLRPVNFTYKTDELKLKQYGLIAEEVEKVKPEFVSYNNDGVPETVSYSAMISPLIKAVQEQKAVIESQQKEIDELKSMVKELAGRK